MSTADQNTKQSSQLIAYAEKEAELFHTPEGEAFAAVKIHDHRESCPIQSTRFKRWLEWRFYSQNNRTPGSQALTDAQANLAARALYESHQEKVSVRVARANGRIYIDRGSRDWKIVEVDGAGWREASHVPVRFYRPSGMGALPDPVPSGKMIELRNHVNLASDDDFHLVLAWLSWALTPDGPFPALALFGPQGSAKSWTARILRSLIDPVEVELRSLPTNERDLMIMARNSWAVMADNCSYLPGWLSDAFCRLATGGGIGTRKLYSDDEEVLFHGSRPLLLNGITEFVTRPDLVERSIALTLPRIRDNDRRDEASLSSRFTDAKPRVFGALLDVVSGAIARYPDVRLSRLPRMADFARWGVAVEQALRWEEGSFLRAYAGNRFVAQTAAVENDRVVDAIQGLLAKDGFFEGTATELLSALDAQVDERTYRSKIWPASAQKLSERLRRQQTSLELLGIEIIFDIRKDSRGSRIVRVQKIETDSSDASDTSASDQTHARLHVVAREDASDTSDASTSTFWDDLEYEEGDL